MADWNNPSTVGVVKVMPNDSIVYIKIDAPGLANMITASCIDRNGDLWVQCQDSYVRRIRARTNQIDSAFGNIEYTSSSWAMGMDDKDNLWIGSTWPSRCLAIFRNGSYYTTLLNSELVYFINMQKLPAVWVGTTKGIYEFNNMQITQSYITSQLGGIPSDMAVDSTGIWFAISGGGVKKLDNNGTFIKSYTTADGLVDDRALGVEVDSKNQTLWIGTANGLSRCIMDTTRPIPTSFRVNFYPNPFVASKGDKKITFQLDKDKFNGGKVNIYTLSGKLLISKENNGQPTVVWDTKDESGKLVPSGIYMFVIYLKDKNKQIGKLAIIR